MSSDDQQFLGSLAAIPHQLLAYSAEVTETFEKKCDELGLLIRENLSSATWLPPQARPAPPPQRLPNGRLFLAPRSMSQKAYDFIIDHRAILSGVAAFVGTGAFYYYHRRRTYLQKRRAKRGINGQRTEVVVLAGNPSSAVLKAIAADLERRGFIVYVVVSSVDEEEEIRKERKKEMHPLHIDVTNPFDVQTSLEHFQELLDSPTQQLHLTGFILIPDAAYTQGPLEIITPEAWSDTFNSQLIHPIAMTQAFLRTIISRKARILILTPTVTASISLPFSGPENTTITALESFTSTLHKEMRPLGVPVSNFKLGKFNLDNMSKDSLLRNASSDVLSWPSAVRENYAQTYMSMSGTSASSVAGTPLRALHNALFDGLTRGDSLRAVTHVGRGSLIYPTFARLAPNGLVAWMLGYGRIS